MNKLIKMNHILDIQDKYFNDIKIGIKTFEIRRNNRNYSVNDTLTLVNLQTNETLVKTIIYVTDVSIYDLEHILILGIK
jgi:ASC-1-like (ASCH) protein